MTRVDGVWKGRPHGTLGLLGKPTPRQLGTRSSSESDEGGGNISSVLLLLALCPMVGRELVGEVGR